MYDTRFKKWGLSKYMKASEKTQYLHNIIQATQGSSQLPEVGDLELFKILRHLRRMHHQETRRDTHSHEARNSQETDQKTASAEKLAEELAESIDSSNMSDHDHQSVHQSRKFTTDEEITPGLTNSLVLYSTSFGCQTTQGSVDMHRLLLGVQASCTTKSRALDPHSVLANKAFWSTVKQAIHLFRTSCHARAWPTLDCAYNMAGDALRFPDISSFVHEALATLSPTNTKESPLIRLQLLRYLANLSSISIGECHPITTILEQLCLDDIHKRDVSERCLEYVAHLASADDGEYGHCLALNAQLSISRLLRKDNDHDAALRIAQAVHTKAVAAFGNGSKPVVKALRQQVHVLIDAEDYTGALEKCLSVVSLTGFDTSDAIYTMEDLAHIYGKLGNMEARRQWLNRAAVSAQCLWGDAVATAHITDKILGIVG